MVFLAADAGVAIVLGYLAAYYLVVPALWLRAARRRGPDAMENLRDHERSRFDRHRDAAAVREEHGDPDAAALRDVAELRGFVVRIMERAIRTP